MSWKEDLHCRFLSVGGYQRAFTSHIRRFIHIYHLYDHIHGNSNDVRKHRERNIYYDIVCHYKLGNQSCNKMVTYNYSIDNDYNDQVHRHNHADSWSSDGLRHWNKHLIHIYNHKDHDLEHSHI